MEDAAARAVSRRLHADRTRLEGAALASRLRDSRSQPASQQSILFVAETPKDSRTWQTSLLPPIPDRHHCAHVSAAIWTLHSDLDSPTPVFTLTRGTGMSLTSSVSPTSQCLSWVHGSHQARRTGIFPAARTHYLQHAVKSLPAICNEECRWSIEPSMISRSQCNATAVADREYMIRLRSNFLAFFP